jgi:hypothetical protein
MPKTEYLVDSLAVASIGAPSDNYVDLEKIILERDVETAIFQHPPSTITFPPLTIGKEAVLYFGIGIKQAAWPLIKNEVRFTISIESTPGREIVFFGKLNPRRRKSDRGWHRSEVDLSQFEGQSVRIILQTQVAWRRSTEYAWAGWANPRLVHHVAESTRVPRRDAHPHIFLLTADALPARYLGCYGHRRVQTPSLDRLASEGVLFEQAWSQSCMTTGSYISILTGQHPHQHGVSREWQPFPVSQVSLPKVLEQNGYHTLFAASSLELSGRTNYLDQVFNEVLPTLSNPMQDGAVTTRQFINWFEQRPDQPCFSWVHYFDVHPPSMPPREFNSMYYEGDPTSSEREYLPEAVAEIRSVESVLIVRAAMPLLESGQPVAEVLDVLEDTAAVLKGQSDFKPDLAEHVLNLGAPAMRGRSRADFGQWLADQAREMAAGRVPTELVEWLKDVTKMLESTELDIMSWLRDVKDFRYPLAMYMSTVSHLDTHINTLTSYLKEQKIYDQSLIVVTSPHGELLENSTIPYHHFLLTPDTLHVPLIMKLPKQAGDIKSGARIGGVFDLIDLFPTLLEIQGLENSSRLAGTSRWNQIKRVEDIPAHDSFAAGLHQLAQSIYRAPYLLVREKSGIGMRTFHTLASGADEVLYNANTGEAHLTDLPEVAKSMREALEDWSRQAEQPFR